MELILYDSPKSPVKHLKCRGYRDDWTLEFDCGYETDLTCDHCKYGVGRKDPEAKCNQTRLQTHG